MTLLHGDLFERLPELDPQSVDVVVTDPPYGIGFMGREWDTFKPDTVARMNWWKRRRVDVDEKNPNLKGRGSWWGGASVAYDRSLAGSRRYQAWTREWATALIPALKPAGHLVVCASPRMQHRVASGLEDAGFEIRDTVIWLHGSGFPKSKELAAGLGSALKPAHEPIIIARAPFAGSLIGVHREYGTGALSIEDCLIPGADGDGHWSGDDGSDATSQPGFEGGFTSGGHRQDAGRWPANVVLDEDAAAMLDAQTGTLRSGAAPTRRYAALFSDRVYSGAFKGASDCPPGRGEGASRFFYCAKASREERERGCEHLELRSAAEHVHREPGSPGMQSPSAGAGRTSGGRNHHPTVKPLALMRWLVRLASQQGQTILDPFMGSGTTGIAASLEGRGFVGIDRELDYIEIAEARIQAWTAGGPLLDAGVEVR